MASPIDFVSGCVGGAAGVIIGHPFDTVKVIMQTSKQHISAMSVIRNCSISSLYQGIKAPLTGLAAINAVVFGVYGSVMRFCPGKSRKHDLMWSGLAGLCAGMTQSIISAPMELVKTRAQLNSITEWNCMKRILRYEGGLRGLYRGFGITIARDCPAFATYFFTYEWMMGNIQKNSTTKQEHPSTVDMLVAGGTAGALSWLVIYPLDVIKSRIQADNRYLSVSHCLRDTIDREGLNVLMRGCSPTLLRAFPANGATFVVVTWTLLAYEKYVNQSSSTNHLFRSSNSRNVDSATQEAATNVATVAAKSTTTTTNKSDKSPFIQES
ncbi:mitochondrial basic amino acids transporter-like [Dermatophagoides pteronyssinus]|uniref:Mitochondrial basic amino acids transporter-like n=1 Tax=Dermatophagoides pteronyssinus TaxID=6956 RepID=A0A6P6XS49_DERPT|nr:mitochondrial basic amino acids transporter-like [Dermatophagoides pteronyssinus]